MGSDWTKHHIITKQDLGTLNRGSVTLLLKLGVCGTSGPSWHFLWAQSHILALQLLPLKWPGKVIPRKSMPGQSKGGGSRIGIWSTGPGGRQRQPFPPSLLPQKYRIPRRKENKFVEKKGKWTTFHSDLESKPFSLFLKLLWLRVLGVINTLVPRSTPMGIPPSCDGAG